MGDQVGNRHVVGSPSNFFFPPPPFPLSPSAPAQVTGPLASKDWRFADLPVEQYRLQTPGTPRQTPMVPHAEPDKVYDIKYFTRDAKRSDIKVGGTDQLRHVTYTYSLEALAAEVAGDLQAGGAPAGPPAASTFRTWQGERVGLLDTLNDGYE